MKPSEILRMAARRIERRGSRAGGGCINILRAASVPLNGNLRRALRQSPAKEAYSYFVMVRPAHADAMWWENHPPRIIGLCFAAAIAESEGN